MSVPVGQRGESKAQFIATADEIEIYTIQRCAKFPQEYREYILKDITRIASEAASHVIRGNAIYPVRPKSGDMTQYKGDVIRRRTYFRRAIEAYMDLGNKIQKLYKVKPPNKKHRGQMAKWASLIGREIDLLKGVLEADRKRYPI